jgi:lipopolysaccharide export system permease protein
MREVLRPTLIGLGIIMLLFTAFTMAALLRDAALDGIPAGRVLMMLLVRDLIALQVVLPSAFFVGLVMAFATWHTEREAYVCYAAGITPRRLARPAIVLAVGVALVVGALSIAVRPWSYAMSYRLNDQLTQLGTDLMQPGSFYRWNRQLVIHAQDIRNQAPRLVEVFAAQRSASETQLIRARYANISEPDAANRQTLEFLDGTSYQLNFRDESETATTFGRLVYQTDRGTEPQDNNHRRAKTTGTLLGSEDLKDIAEWQWRVNLPLVSFMLALFATQLGRLQPRQTPYVRFGIALVVYVAVFNLTSIVTTAVESAQLPPAPGVFTITLLMLLGYAITSRLPILNLSRPR